MRSKDQGHLELKCKNCFSRISSSKVDGLVRYKLSSVYFVYHSIDWLFFVERNNPPQLNWHHSNARRPFCATVRMVIGCIR